MDKITELREKRTKAWNKAKAFLDAHRDESGVLPADQAEVYTKAKSAVVKALLRDDFTITGRQYIGYETSTGYHNYNVDVAKYYELEE